MRPLIFPFYCISFFISIATFGQVDTHYFDSILIEKNYDGFDSTYFINFDKTIDLKGSMFVNYTSYLGLNFRKTRVDKKVSGHIFMDMNIWFKFKENTSLTDNKNSLLFLFDDGEIKEFKYCCHLPKTHSFEKDVVSVFNITLNFPLKWTINKKITAIRITTSNYNIDYNLSAAESYYIENLFTIIKDAEFSKSRSFEYIKVNPLLR